jgi:hypothetical protein
VCHMNQNWKVRFTAFVYASLVLAASSGCTCTPEVCYPHSSAHAGSAYSSYRASAGRCPRSMPVGYYPTTWQPLVALTADPTPEPELIEELRDGTSDSPTQETDRPLPLKPEAMKSGGTSTSPLPVQMDSQHNDFDSHRVGGRKWKSHAPTSE